jgi:hypothetical protein
MSADQPAAQRQKLEAKAAELKALPEGWDSYGSVVIDPEAADKAVELALALAPHFPSYGTPALVPTSDGAVQVECHSDGWNMECYVRRAK